MTHETDILNVLKKLEQSAPSGYALALHIRYTSPTVLLQTYPKNWSDYYSEKGLVLSDPTVAWGFQNEGVQRWSALSEQDTAGVMALAAQHGLAYGVVCAIETDDSRSVCSCARADREYTDAEIADFASQIKALHALTKDHHRFSAATAAELETMAVRLTESDSA